jgi:hypothetical protein
MELEGQQMIVDKGFHPENVFESDFCKTQKLADFDEFMASRRTSSSSPIGKKDDAMYISGQASSVPTSISMDTSSSGLQSTDRQNLFSNLTFYKREGKTIGLFAESIQNDIKIFNDTIAYGVNKKKYQQQRMNSAQSYPEEHL